MQVTLWSMPQQLTGFESKLQSLTSVRTSIPTPPCFCLGKDRKSTLK